MNNRTLMIFVASLALAGCKPKQTSVTGQVFIAPMGGVNLKLGGVEVQLLEKEQVTEYLNGTRPLVQSNRALCRRELEAAQADLQKAQDEYNLLLANRPHEMKAEFVETKANLDRINQEIETLSKGIDSWRTNNTPLQAAALAAVQATEAAAARSQELVRQANTRGAFANPNARMRAQGAQLDSRRFAAGASLQYGALASLARALFEHPTAIGDIRADSINLPVLSAVRIQELATWETFLLRAREGLHQLVWESIPERQAEVHKLQGRLQEISVAARFESLRKIESAQARITGAKSRLEETASPGAYLDGFQPTPLQKVSTDAEGNFALTCSHHKALMVFAKAQPASITETPRSATG